MFTHNEELEIFYIHNLIKVHWLLQKLSGGQKDTKKYKKKKYNSPIPAPSFGDLQYFYFLFKKENAFFLMTQYAHTYTPATIQNFTK